MAGNKDLNAAAKAKKDEFYTQLVDIEKEMRHYERHFRDKTVFCNCDDPFESDFFRFFVLNFNRLGLKRLVATCYAGSPIAGKQLSLFGGNAEAGRKRDKPYKAVVTRVEDKDGNGSIDMCDVKMMIEAGEIALTELAGDGDFRSPECLEILDEADIVVTNPPFSLFRQYVATLMEHKKKFIIIGNVNAITYKEIFPLLMNNEMWIGPSIHSGDRAFYVPDDYPLEAAGCGVDENGRRFIRVKGVRWYTNLDFKQRHEELVFIRRYNQETYPRYVNYDAIEVASVSDIPGDYAGLMGVPITFMDKYSPDQFEIVGISRELGKPMSQFAKPGTYQTGGMRFYLHARDKGYEYKRLYDRLVIRNKHPEEPQA